MTKNDLVVVLGPTASGKTGLAIEIAKAFNGEVVSCDSMQIYKGLPISTAQPTEQEKQGIKHHLIGFVDAKTNFSVGEYQKLARAAIEDIQSRGKLPVLCGGTGLYVDSVIYNMDFAKVSGDSEIRRKYTEFYEQNGSEALHNLLKQKVGDDAAAKTHPNNVNRIIRALEVFDLTGKGKKEYYNKNMKTLFYSNTMLIGTTWDRKDLYERVNKRVDIMFEEGLKDEIKTIFEYGVKEGNTAFKAIGCKELYLYFNGEISIEQAKDKIKQYSRNYAKRQITWFKRLNDVNWIDFSNNKLSMKRKASLYEKITNNYF